LLNEGKGSFGSITSAVTVAASSFDMTITDPTILLDDIDADNLQEILGTEWEADSPLQYVEPAAKQPPVGNLATNEVPVISTSTLDDSSPVVTSTPAADRVITGKVQTLGDFIDTDALAPAESLFGVLSVEEMGKFCLLHTHPNFRGRVKDGLNVVVAGKAFGVGSSRDNAVTALIGAGVQCVIARSFAFIYARNQPSIGLLGIVMEDEDFYKLAMDEADIQILIDERTVKVGGRTFGFSLSELEVRLWELGGMSAAFARWGKKMLENVTAQTTSKVTVPQIMHHEELKW
jgi:3-isopropylmalate dehydratase small subunit